MVTLTFPNGSTANAVYPAMVIGRFRRSSARCFCEGKIGRIDGSASSIWLAAEYKRSTTRLNNGTLARD
jgi:hypothetical protein